MKFESLGLKRPILDALREQGYRTPTPIQEQAIPAALAGRDVLGCARTGTGKTCAFAAPILQRLSDSPVQGHPIRALVLAPTRELAIQDEESFVAYGSHLQVPSTVIFGGVGQAPQVERLQAGCEILVATPGRLEDLHSQGFVDVSHLEVLVLDEADRMLDMGFIHDVRKILAWLPKQKQTLFFSATMPPEITQLVDSLLHDPVKLAVDPVSSPVDVISQRVYQVDKGNKTKLLIYLLEGEHISSALVFTRTKHGANKVAQDLVRAKISAAAIHGNKSQTARQDALAGFKNGTIRVLVATDIAARGLDIEDMPCVFNYNLPEVPETYVHRIGRTGRAGKGGTAISFCDFGEKPLLRDIEKLIGHRVPEVEGHPFPMEIFEVPEKEVRGRAAASGNNSASRGKSSTPAGGTRPSGTGKTGKAAQPAPAAGKGKNNSARPAPAGGQAKASGGKTPEKARPIPVPAEPEEQDFGTVRLPQQKTAYHRPERKPLSALDEIAPALPEDEIPQTIYGEKRTGHLRNTFFTPEEQKAYAGDPDPFMDATARLFATRKSIPVQYQTGSGEKGAKAAAKPSGSGSGKNNNSSHNNGTKTKQGGSKSQPAGGKSSSAPQSGTKGSGQTSPPASGGSAAGAAKQGQKKKKKKRKSGSRPQTKSAAAQGTPATTARILESTPKPAQRKRSHDRPMPQQRSIYGAHKRDSTEQKSSLMKPYYLSDD